MDSTQIQRISVVGTTGAGKTTVARQIAQRLQIPHVELDALYWNENWTGVSEATFRDRVVTAVQGKQWVIDGNYSRIRSIVWERAEMVVYLDYSFSRVFWQLLQRTIRRSLYQQELWQGNRESLQKHYLAESQFCYGCCKLTTGAESSMPNFSNSPLILT